jgi:hypothetical protein
MTQSIDDSMTLRGMYLSALSFSQSHALQYAAMDPRQRRDRGEHSHHDNDGPQSARPHAMFQDVYTASRDEPSQRPRSLSSPAPFPGVRSRHASATGGHHPSGHATGGHFPHDGTVVRPQLESLAGSPDSHFAPARTPRAPASHAPPPPPLPSAQHTLSALGLATPSGAGVTPPNLRQTGGHGRTSNADNGCERRHTVADLHTRTRERLHGLRSPTPHVAERCAANALLSRVSCQLLRTGRLLTSAPGHICLRLRSPHAFSLTLTGSICML